MHVLPLELLTNVGNLKLIFLNDELSEKVLQLRSSAIFERIPHDHVKFFFFLRLVV